MTGYDQIEHASTTDVGVRRSHNQDAHAVFLASDAEQWERRGHVFLVADGMGGHAVGELAAELAVGIIPHTYHKYAHEGADAALRKAFLEANASIHARGQQNREFEGMGTTTTALLLRPEGAWVGHVGDSRCYRIRGDKIEQLTFDHSWVWELARRQGVKPETLQHIPSNRIMRSLGTEALVQVDIEGPHPLQDSDIFVVCSDGLSGQVSDHEIGAVATVLPPAEACQFLTHLANLRGGPDNITVLVVRAGDICGNSRAPAASPARRRKPWYDSFPWALTALLLGVILAFWAAVLTASNDSAGKYVFVLAAAVCLGGLAGLSIQYVREQRRPAQQPRRPRLKTYRQTACAIERPMLAKLAKAATALEQQVREKGWEADWTAYKKHQQLAETWLGRSDLKAAFSEYCLAIRPLTDAFQRYRNKEEAFQPLWDKMAD
ncbi:MAG TPA: protein phosphatase 2C domain-containing protein [Gemmataceae bacterium]|nr:protein phosphatase 2C domain-containing protein [Gemmataceae bacterium]